MAFSWNLMVIYLSSLLQFLNPDMDGPTVFLSFLHPSISDMRNVKRRERCWQDITIRLKRKWQKSCRRCWQVLTTGSYFFSSLLKPVVWTSQHLPVHTRQQQNHAPERQSFLLHIVAQELDFLVDVVDGWRQMFLWVPTCFQFNLLMKLCRHWSCQRSLFFPSEACAACGAAQFVPAKIYVSRSTRQQATQASGPIGWDQRCETTDEIFFFSGPFSDARSADVDQVVVGPWASEIGTLRRRMEGTRWWKKTRNLMSTATICVIFFSRLLTLRFQVFLPPVGPFLSITKKLSNRDSIRRC